MPTAVDGILISFYLAGTSGRHTIEEGYMAIYVAPGGIVRRDGGSFQEVSMNTQTHTVLAHYGRYCTIRDNEQAPPTSKPNRHWLQIFRTPDNTE